MDIGTLTGSIAIEDQLSGALNTATAQVMKFVEGFDGALGAVAIGAGAVVTAMAAVTGAVAALGSRGADVNDLRETIEEFAGSVEAAEGVIQGLREGTRNTVGDFELMQSAARGLQAGVKLSTEQFEDLGEAAFVMANRGLGTVEQNLDTLIQSMITGRTRSLEMKLGIIGAKDATEDYATSIGKTKAELSETEVLEAKRHAVMGIVSKVTQSASGIQDDFNDRLAQSSVRIRNFIDSLASAVDNSPVVASAMDGIGQAIIQAFGGNSQNAVDTIMAGINRFAVLVVDAGIATVEAVRVMNTGWSLVKTVVLGVTTVFVGLLDGVVRIGAGVDILVAKMKPWDQEAQNNAARARTLIAEWDGMTASMAAQTAEAAKGVRGASEFDKKLDEIGGTLFTVRDRTVAAMKATGEHTKVVNESGTAFRNEGGAIRFSADQLKDRAAADREFTATLAKHTQERLKAAEDEGVFMMRRAAEQYQERQALATNFYTELVRQATTNRTAEETQQDLLSESAARHAMERTQIAEAEGVRAINAAKETYDKIQAETEKHNQQMAEYGAELGDLLVSSLTGGGGFMGAIQAYASKWGSRLGKMVGGAFGPLGSALGDSIGSLIGPLVGKLKDVLSKPEWKKLASDIGRDWGVTISEELAKSMEANSKRFGRAVAQLLDMDKIIEEAGGVESFGVEKAIDKLKSAFSWFEMGELSVEQLGEVIDENFGNIIPHAMGEASGLLTKGARELLDLAEASGVVSESMREFVTGQLGSALDGLGKVIVTSERAAQSVGSAIAASFGELIRQGVSLPQALAQAMPAVQALEEQLKKTGFSGGAALDEIRGLVTLASDEIAGPMLESVAGVGQALAGLQNSGILTQEMFVGLAGQVTDTFNSLVAQGYDGNQALLLMQPTLQTLWELQQDFGFTVDDSTQALIDQAETQGLVGEQMRDINERILGVLEAIAEVLGADIPGAAEDAAAAITDSLGDLEFEVDVRYNYDTSGEPTYNALGSGWTPRGSDTIPAMIGPGERVLNPQETQDYQSGRHEGDPELAALRRDMIYVMPGLIANATTVAMAKTGIGRR